MSIEQCRDRLPLPELWTVLGLAGAEAVQRAAGGTAAKIKSPFREDRKPSVSVWLSEGRWWWKDHGQGDKASDEVGLIEAAKGCSSQEAIRIWHELAGLSFGKGTERARSARKSVPEDEDSRASRGRQDHEQDAHATERAKPGKVVKVYDYHDPLGQVAHQTLRLEPKSFRQRRPAKEGESSRDGWMYSLKGADLYPYRLTDWQGHPDFVSGARPLFLVEGEKDADTLAGLGLLSTTLPMGAGKWRGEYADWFRDRWVVIVEDFDRLKRGERAGEKGAMKVAGELLEVCSRLGYLRLPELWRGCREGQDISDWVEWQRGCEAAEEEIAAELVEHAAISRAPEALVMERASASFDAFADAVVAFHELMYSGSRYWQYRRGRWVVITDEVEVQRMVRGALRAAGKETSISSRTLGDAVGLMRSSHLLEHARLGDEDKGLLNVANGMLDVDSLELLPHGPGYYSTSQLPVAWDPGASCPRWREWLEQMQPEEDQRALLQEIAGYCLVLRENYHAFFVMFGDGGTGKSTYCEMIRDLVGEENTTPLRLQEMDNAFTRYQLVGKKLYMCQELEGNSFKNIGLIKSLASGEPIYVDVKNRQGFDYVPRGRLLMQSNVRIATPDASEGFGRRFFQVDWRNQIPEEKRDYGLGKKLQVELPGFLNWAVEGYRRLHARGRFAHTRASQAAKDELMRHRSQVKMFLADPDWVVVGAPSEAGGITTGALFELYKEWAEEHDVEAFYKELIPFMREVMTVRPEWREGAENRKERRRIDGTKRYVLRGVRAGRSTVDDF